MTLFADDLRNSSKPGPVAATCTARCDTVLDRVPNIAQLNLVKRNLAQLNFAAAAKSVMAGQKRRNNRPFLVSHVT